MPGLLLLAMGLGGCQGIGAKVWNLKQVHESDGSPRWQADLHSDLGYALREPIERMLGRAMTEGKLEVLDDPYKICLDNLIALGKLSKEEPGVIAAKAEIFSWLATVDTYVLSREVAARNLGPVGRSLGLVEIKTLPEVGASPKEVAATLTTLIRAAQPLLVGDPYGSYDELKSACDAALAEVRTFEGERRLYTALTSVLGGPGFENPLIAPLTALHRELGAAAVGHAIAVAKGDVAGRVRAAAFESEVTVRGQLDAGLLAYGIDDPSRDVALALLANIRTAGLPDVPEQREAWLGWIVEAAQNGDGQITVAACEALSMLFPGHGRTLRHEAWSIWWSQRRSISEGKRVDAALPSPR